MRCRAALACRSPPRLRRWRWVLPEDASTGLMPQRAANDASLRSRSGLSPAAMTRAAALKGPIPTGVSSCPAQAVRASMGIREPFGYSPDSMRDRMMSAICR